MKKLLSIFTSKKAGPIASALCAVLLCLLTWTQYTSNAKIKDLTNKLNLSEIVVQNRTDDLKQCRVNSSVLTDTITHQNASIDELKKDGDDRSARLENVANQGKSDAAKAYEDALKILSRTAEGDLCKAADQLIKDAA